MIFTVRSLTAVVFALAITTAVPVAAHAQEAPECPANLDCRFLPAAYDWSSTDHSNPNNYGNYDPANRPGDGQQIRYIVIHDTESLPGSGVSPYDQAIATFQKPESGSSAHYVIRSSDGQVTQMVPTKDVAWHAGNWTMNEHSIGIEHEGIATQGGTWYTEQMYRASADLVKFLAAKYHIPLDREHILGHEDISRERTSNFAAAHWDPGPYWDWSHYFDLLGAPLGGFGLPGSSLVTIDPDFAKNQPIFTGCDTAGTPCPARGSEAVVLHSEPNDASPLLKDVGLHPNGSPSTMAVSDVGSRAATGQRYAVAEVRGDWTAIWYLGQKGWFHNPRNARVAKPAIGWVVTPKPGLATVPVYGRAYPEPEAYPANVTVQAITPLPYTLAAGQKYSSAGTVGSEYYSATTFDVADHVVVKGKLKYVQIQFGHRIAFVKADDVRIVPAF